MEYCISVFFVIFSKLNKAWIMHLWFSVHPFLLKTELECHQWPNLLFFVCCWLRVHCWSYIWLSRHPMTPPLVPESYSKSSNIPEIKTCKVFIKVESNSLLSRFHIWTPDNIQTIRPGQWESDCPGPTHSCKWPFFFHSLTITSLLCSHTDSTGH